MGTKVVWTKETLETFIEEAMIVDELELKVLRTRIAEWSRTKQSQEFNISLSTLDRIIKKLKHKYNVCQKRRPDFYPKPRLSDKEKWMDTH